MKLYGRCIMQRRSLLQNSTRVRRQDSFALSALLSTMGLESIGLRGKQRVNSQESQASFQTRYILSEVRQGLERLVDIYPDVRLRDALSYVYELEAQIDTKQEDEHAMYLGAW